MSLQLDFEDAVKVFSQTVILGVKYGVDLVIVETMNDSYETKAALLAVKENCDLPVIVTNAYSDNGRLMTGATPSAMVALLEGMGVDALGANCSLGPRQLSGVAQELLENASVPVVLKPNAGLPKVIEGKTVFEVTQSYYKVLLDGGVKIYEYTPGFNHAKIFVSDDLFGSISTLRKLSVTVREP